MTGLQGLLYRHHQTPRTHCSRGIYIGSGFGERRSQRDDEASRAKGDLWPVVRRDNEQIGLVRTHLEKCAIEQVQKL